MILRKALPLIAALVLVAAACGDAGSDTTEAPPAAVVDGPFPQGAFAIRASSDLGVGPERLLVAVGGPSNERLGGPGIPVSFVLAHETAPDQATAVPAEFLWVVPEVSGLYRAAVDFDRSGIWLVTVLPEDGGALDPVPVAVQEDPLTPAIGEAAPPSDSVTADDVADLAEISTDPSPEARFYEMSVAEAVSSGAPSVIVFATPKFCQTAACGPMLDTIKAMSGDYPSVNFVHVEVFTNLDDPQNLEVVAATQEWGLPTEPWVFVVDSAGVVQGRYEGVAGDAELRNMLDSLA
jgi:hypothetical protein